MTDPSLVIREERSRDREAVRAVNVAAFGGDAEADLVERLRDDGDTLFGLVAEVGGQIAGHVLFSRLPIETARGVVSAAALAPLAVLPVWQRQGIGAALVREGLTRCRERQVPAVVVLGDPAYYSRFGFRTETARRLQTPWSGPHLMAVELAPGRLAGGQGVARYPAAFADL
jgi:putative acetyltransferase